MRDGGPVTAVDVAVVGAGPAGSTAAIAAARRGFSVALIDRQSFPRDKACGDALGPRTTAVLHSLGLEVIVTRERVASSLFVVGPDKSEFRTRFEALDSELANGYVIPRIEFDDELRAAALDAGAHDYAGHRLVATGVAGGTRWLRLRSGQQEMTLNSQLLIGADGAYSATRSFLGVKRPPLTAMAIATRAYCSTEAFDSGELDMTMIFECSRDLLPGYGWIFPTGRGRANIGVGYRVSAVRGRQVDLNEKLEQFADSWRLRGVQLGPLEQRRAHQLPLASRTPRLRHERATLIGDAASMINPASGEGIAYGMTSATELVSRLPAHVDDRPRLDASLRSFERWFRRTHRRHFLAGELTCRLAGRPWLASRIIRASRHDNTIARDILDIQWGLGTIRPGLAWRLLRARP